jgi:hypothetical protein
LWEKRIKEVQEGKAYLSIRKWTGLPYRSPQEELFKFDKSHGVGIEKLQLSQFGAHFNGYFVSTVYDIYKRLALNDGLSVDDFCEWFYGLEGQDLAIIHFTDFRYNQ